MNATSTAPGHAETHTSEDRPVANAAVSRTAARTGRVIAGFVSAFLLFDGAARVVQFAPYVEGLVEFGYPERFAIWIGLALVVSTTLYLIASTAVLGAILMTGYLGGAAASHVQMQDPWFLFPIVLGVLAWLALYLRDGRIRALLPLRQ